jgi:hypothetical protein
LNEGTDFFLNLANRMPSRLIDRNGWKIKGLRGICGRWKEVILVLVGGIY